MESTGGMGTGESATEPGSEPSTSGGTTAVADPRANVFGHESLSGTYRTRLEASGRLVLPAALRRPFVVAGAGHLLARRGEVLWLLTATGFEEMVDAVVAQSGGMLAPETRSNFFKAAPKVAVDRQSRFVVPPDHRDLLGLEGEAELVLAGAIERVEIWPAGTWDAQEAPKLADLDLLLDGHPGLPTGTA